jgi:hypothetical protein
VKSQQYQYPRPLSLSTAAITLPVPVPGLRRRVVVAARSRGQLARIGLDLALARLTMLGSSQQHLRCSGLSCIGLVATLGEVVEDGLGVVGDAWWRGDLLVAEADGGGPQRS